MFVCARVVCHCAYRDESRTPTHVFTATGGLHHRYVKSGSGKVLYSILSSFPRMLGNQSDLRYALIAINYRVIN